MNSMGTPAIRQEKDRPVVALVGRVNVGKSTLFNKLIEDQKAIVSDVAGTTRTRNEGIVLWRGQEALVIDTGGLTFSDDVILEDDIIKQTKVALKEADVIIFVTDGQTGILPQERELAQLIRKAQRPTLLVANKVDSTKVATRMDEYEWHGLGFGSPHLISAASGRQLGDFLDILFDLLEEKGSVKPKEVTPEPEDRGIRVSLIGKPNVGKSSLFNKLIGEERVIVSDMAHTTREPHDTTITYKYEVGDEEREQLITFVDTAGIRRKANVKGFLEREGIKKSINAIDDSEIVLFVIDGTETISSQDRQLGGLLERHSRSVIILLNKWDMAEDNSEAMRKEVEQHIYSNFPHLSFAPILFVSGLTSYGIHKIFPDILKAWEGRNTVIGVKTLEHFLKVSTAKKLPARGKGTRHPKLMGIRQLNSRPPIFEIFVKYRTSLHRSYINYLENRLREQFNFYATPIVIHLTKMKK